MPVKNYWRKLVFFDELAGLVDGLTTANFANVNAALAQKAPIDLVDNAQPGSYTLTAEAPLYFTRMTSASANVLTVPPTTTATIPLLRPVAFARWGAGVTTITAGAGVTILPANNLRLATQYDMATLMRITGNTWLLKGDAIV